MRVAPSSNKADRRCRTDYDFNRRFRTKHENVTACFWRPPINSRNQIDAKILFTEAGHGESGEVSRRTFLASQLQLQSGPAVEVHLTARKTPQRVSMQMGSACWHNIMSAWSERHQHPHVPAFISIMKGFRNCVVRTYRTCECGHRCSHRRHYNGSVSALSARTCM